MGQIEKAHKGLPLIVFPTLSSGILFLLLLFSNVFFQRRYTCMSKSVYTFLAILRYKVAYSLLHLEFFA